MNKKKSNFFNILKLYARKYNIVKKLTYILTTCAILSVLATFATFYNVGPFLPTPTTLFILMTINLISLLILGAMLGRQIINLWATQKKEDGSIRLHRRIVTLFSIVAITPTIIVAIVSGMFFEFGLQNWFSDKVRTVLDNSQEVAEAYIKEHKNALTADVNGIAKFINSQSFLLSQNPQLLEQNLTEFSNRLKLSEAIIFNRQGQVMARARTPLSSIGGSFPLAALDLAAEGNVVPIVVMGSDDRVRVLVALEGLLDKFLYISRFVDPNALALVKSSQDARSDYMKAFNEQSQYRWWFNLSFFAIAFLILFAAILLGLNFAKRLMKPITHLVAASEMVGKGDFSIRTPMRKGFDDLGGLTPAFNKMTHKLDQQQKDIIQTRLKLEERNRFVEAVLSGVSAGIMGLDAKGNITLSNRSAAKMMGLELGQIREANILQIIPEIEDLFAGISATKSKYSQDQIIMERGGKNLTFLVRITSELKKGKIQGFVIAFDDITDQVAAQRNAAWADIARRIAHEIKNPLTPIQLSAERLKRKYLGEITSDPSIFTQCTDTIVRQVGDLRRMVDEFSSFAQLPAPVIKSENLNEIIKQAYILQDITSNNIQFDVDCPQEPVYIECDRGQIGQALTNLVKNATESIIARKATIANDDTPYQGKISISLQNTMDHLKILVIDNGLGLPGKLMDKLTEPYITTRKKGTGLGLAIVKKIMIDHGGDLILENNRDAGASITLNFPATILSRKTQLKIV